ncbi:MAG: O-antigen ligase family protein [Breznakibacter sp.]
MGFLFRRPSLYWLLIGVHLLLGMLMKFAPVVVGYYFVGIVVLSLLIVVVTGDKDYMAGYFALYVVGFELMYRMSGSFLFYEMGKYSAIAILFTGILIRKGKGLHPLFLLLLGLLIPAIFLASDPEPGRAREMVMFNMSGPLSLLFSAAYFFRKPITKEQLLDLLRFVFLPAFTLVVGISLVASLDTLVFTSVQSNPLAAGGFAANQVSTIFGWFILIAVFFALQGFKLTPLRGLDYAMIGLLFLRGLLTLSRGGILSMLTAILIGLGYLFLKSHTFRTQLNRMKPYILGSLVVLIITVWVANSLSNNFLLYRYQGKSTSEVLTGEHKDGKSYLSGRENIMLGDLKAFADYPMFGTGYGMAMMYHYREFGHAAAAHTEYSRLLAEQGLMGLLFILIAYLIMPIRHFLRYGNLLQRSWFLVFFFIGFFTMFHAAMRLAMPGVVMGFAYLMLVPDASVVHRKNEETEPLK